MSEITEKEDKDISFKHWLSRTIMIAVISFIVVYSVERYFEIPLVVTALIAIFVTIFIFLVHEGLHYYKAINLGYEVTWYRSKFMMGFDINRKGNKKEFLKDVNKIAVFPYYFLLPISLLVILIGYQFDINGLIIAGITSLLLHIVSLKKEGIISDTSRYEK